MSDAPPPADGTLAPESPLPSSPPPETSERPSSGWFDYLLMAGTGVLFLLYLPVFGAVPRLASADLQEGHLLWAAPVLSMCSCLAAFCAWVWHGPTAVVRGMWAAAFALAVLGYPAAVLLGMFASPWPAGAHF